MSAAAILRSLWERRVTSATGLAVAVAVALALLYRVDMGLPPTFESRQYHVGIATAEVLVDSPNSQVIDLGGSSVRADVASLSVRARLLADLAATSALKNRIARRSNVHPSLLIALRPSIERVIKPTPLETGASVALSDPRAHILSMRVHEELPIIGIDAQAPNPAKAAQISNAAVEELRQYLERAAAAKAVPADRKLVVEPLGPARAAIEQRGQDALIAVIGASLVFVLWCTAMFVISGFVRGWRESAGEPPAEPRSRADEPPADERATAWSELPSAGPAVRLGTAPERPADLETPRSVLASLDVPEQPERPQRRGAVA